MITVTNPYSGATMVQLPFPSAAELERCLSRSQQASKPFAATRSHIRSSLLHGIVAELTNEKEAFAQLMTQEMGKPITAARFEIDRALQTLRISAEEAIRPEAQYLPLDSTPWGPLGHGMTLRFPRGVVLGITPFNFPINLLAHKLGPALAVGCPIIIKPSPLAPLTVMNFLALVARVADQHLPAEFSPGVAQCVLASDEQTATLIQDPRVAFVSFTGSSRVGKVLKGLAPLKPMTLELGGNAWVIVTAESEVATSNPAATKAAQQIAQGAFGQAGQSCISVQNIAVDARVAPTFIPLLQEATRNFPYGDPIQSETECGTVIHAGAVSRIQELIHQNQSWISESTRSQRKIGLAHPSALMPPQLNLLRLGVAELNRQAPLSLVEEEIFGPVANVIVYDKLADVIHALEKGQYGLQTGVYTQNIAIIDQLWRELQVGGLVINAPPSMRHDAQPYGGWKESGAGREGVRSAMHEMTESKHLALRPQI